jgi:ubiquinol-cytochrome c reductase cytochrome b subunit
MKWVAEWLRDRLGLDPIIDYLSQHKVPASLTTRRGWMYVFGMAVLTAFGVQVITGITLATMYVPSPAYAHESLIYITREASFGAFVRGLHYFGASAMVLFVLVHAAQVYLAAAYKYPREMNWITGVVLLLLVFLMALTGQLLRWDQNGLWTVVVAAKFAARVPLLGPWLGEFILAGPTVGGATLTRFYALHVIVLPLIIVGLVSVHMYLVLYHGISEPPETGRPVNRFTYKRWYQDLKERGVPYLPDVAWKEGVAGLAVFAGIVLLALVFGPRGPDEPPDPTMVIADPRPDWYLRWYYALLWVKPRGLEAFFMVYAPLLALLLLALLPVFFPTGERSLKRRPWAIGAVGGAGLIFVVLTAIGLRVPWSPAYETEPLSAQELGVPEGPVSEGARVFHETGCQYCHLVLGRGGTYGPDLTRVAQRLSPPEITVRIVKGFGDMPSYQGVLTTEELEAVMTFLRELPRLAGKEGR